ncbi:MAG: hypothetical protein DRN12_07055 [Thermoplasmata archaeon]|nr:MAG: hypothetical protein DRN12_07055 [Thermoplasmata archaeon]
MLSLKYSSLFFSLIGLTTLFYISITLQPIYITLDDIPNYEGREVIVRGIVVSYNPTDYGEIISIRDNNTTIPVFLKGEIFLHPGDSIEVIGSVEKYNDKWEINVDDPKYISILSTWENYSTPLWEVAEHPSNYIDLNLNVTGYVDSIYDKWLILSDGNYSILVTFNHLPENISLYHGKKVLLHAYFTYDSTTARYKFEIKSREHFIRGA